MSLDGVRSWLEALIPAPLYLGATSRVDPQPGPIPVVLHTGGAGVLRTCTRCDVAAALVNCWICGDHMT